MRLTTEIYLQKLKDSWANCPYDLSSINYIKNNVKITPVCSTHGLFEKWPSDFLKKSGCPKCVGQGKTASEHIDELKLMYPHYDFSQFIYKNAKTKSTVICKYHGAFQSKTNDLKMGHGCFECGKNTILRKRIISGKCRHPDDISEYEKYRKAVWRYTNQTYRKFKNDLGERNKSNHLDHIYSIVDGWANKVDPKIIGHITNLRILCGVSNRKKNCNSDILLVELTKLYEEYENGIS